MYLRVHSPRIKQDYNLNKVISFAQKIEIVEEKHKVGV